MLHLWDDQPESYSAWAEEYFEKDNLPIDSIQAIYNHQSFSADFDTIAQSRDHFGRSGGDWIPKARF
jgi:hypothetical protein